jgi:O-antigen/teichoic acid export membrane protein
MTNLSTKLKQLCGDTAVYGVGTILIKALSFVSLPILTRVFTPEDYGNLELYSILAGAVATLINCSLDSAQSYYHYKAEKEGDDAVAELVSAIIQLRLIAGGVAILFALPLLWLWGNAIFAAEIDMVYVLFCLCTTFFDQLANVFLSTMRLQRKTLHFTLFTFLSTSLSLSLTLLFVLGSGYGIGGVLFASLCTSSVLLVLLGVKWRQYLCLRSTVHLWKPLLVFALPLVPTGFAMWILTWADRWFLARYWGLGEVGLYAVGAKVAAVATVAIGTFRTAWWPIAMKVMGAEEAPGLYRFIARAYMAFGAIGVIWFAALSRYFLPFVTTEAYADAWVTIAPLTGSAVFYGFYLIASLGTWQAKKAYHTTYALVVAASMNIFLNWYFIPKYGLHAAAISTAFSQMVACGYLLFVSESVSPVSHSIGRLAATVLVATSGSVAIVMMKGELLVSVGVAGIVTVYSVYEIYSAWVREHERTSKFF